MLSDCLILVFCKTTMSCTFTECSTNWLTTYGPNPRNHLSTGFILHIVCTHNHHVYTQFQGAQYITSPGSHVCTHLGSSYIKLLFHGHAARKHSTSHSSSPPELRMRSKHCCSSKNYVSTGEVRMAVNSPSVTAETPYVLGPRTCAHFVQVNRICCVRLHPSPCKAEYASPATGHY